MTSTFLLQNNPAVHPCPHTACEPSRPPELSVSLQIRNSTAALLGDRLFQNWKRPGSGSRQVGGNPDQDSPLDIQGLYGFITINQALWGLESREAKTQTHVNILII